MVEKEYATDEVSINGVTMKLRQIGYVSQGGGQFSGNGGTISVCQSDRKPHKYILTYKGSKKGFKEVRRAVPPLSSRDRQYGPAPPEIDESFRS